MRNAIPHLSRSGIRELDQFSEAITQLSRDVLNSSTKFLRIMEMASVELGGYELQFDTGSVYYTENFFRMLGMEQEVGEVYTIGEFNQIVEEFTTKNFYKSESEDTVNLQVHLHWMITEVDTAMKRAFWICHLDTSRWIFLLSVILIKMQTSSRSLRILSLMHISEA